MICQKAKAPLIQPVPLQPVLATQPWELVAVDVLKVPLSTKGNQYLLVIQDYFSKWVFAYPMSDQKSETIVHILKDHVFTVVGPPQKLHSDQGRNFDESHILHELCKAFGVVKSRTTPYHPMGDGLVEHMNHSLLSLLRTYVEEQSLWEEHLQLLLYVYRTTKHSSTGYSPHEILFGSNPTPLLLPTLQNHSHVTPAGYFDNLQSKLAQLKELVENNVVKSAESQQKFYKASQSFRRLLPGDLVLLNNPRAGKLDFRWTGPWTVRKMKGNSTVLLSKGRVTQAVHVNRVRPLCTDISETEDGCLANGWSPPLSQYDELPDQSSPSPGPPEAPDDPHVSDPVPPRPPSVLIHHAQSGGPFPVITTSSGRVVKPVQRYGAET